jgi:gamma-glutamylcyclotransferase (GGCT)/AIG2-like uncharacterized protein YtfP
MQRRCSRIAVIAALFSAQLFSAQAFYPPIVISAELVCGEAFQIDVTFNEPVDLVSALDAFNYTVFQDSYENAPYVQGSNVVRTLNRWSFRVFLDHGSFVPDTNSILLVERVTDVAGNPVFREFYPVTPCRPSSLQIARIDQESFQISWATNSAGFRLESCTNLTEPLWEETSTIVVQGGRFTARLNITAEQRFFRLRLVDNVAYGYGLR